MAILKCKMCGGDLALVEGASTAECEYCGSVQTVPKADNEKKLTLFARANRLRAACEFDKAAGIYETIVADFPEEAEAYWGLVLCQYGIEYVDDPATGKKIPTCHRSSYDSVLEDDNLEQAVENADVIAQRLYREEAKELERLRKGILEVSADEQPYDIFICYKETDLKGDRTLDSVLAQDLYAALTDKGYRVFFSRITLRDKLGADYEPAIFAALNSAKVMLAVGTSYEHYNAVWVKNEWSRYLKLCAADTDKHLIPCYRDLDPEDMPREFNHLQGADLSKMGAVQDILFNMEKYIPLQKQAPVTVAQAPAVNNNASLLKRGAMALEDGDWAAADRFFEEVLNQDAECAQAYVGKLMAQLQVKRQQDLPQQKEPFDKNSHYQKAVRFADAALKSELEGYIRNIHEKKEADRIAAVYAKAKQKMDTAKTEAQYKEAASLFNSISKERDAKEMALRCQELAKNAGKQVAYENAIRIMETAGKNQAHVRAAINLFESMPDYEDASKLAEQCRKRLERLKEEAEIEREIQEEKAQKTKKLLVILSVAAVVVVGAVLLLTLVIIPNGAYNDALELMEAGQYEEAMAAFEALDGYEDSAAQIDECKYRQADALQTAGKIKEAAIAFGKIIDYKDARQRSFALWDRFADRATISAGNSHTVALKEDGTIVAIGYDEDGRCNKAKDWTNLIAVDAGEQTVGLKADGTVVSTEHFVYGSGVSEWTDIVAISSTGSITVGLKADGTVLVVGSGTLGSQVFEWTDIVAIAAGDSYVIGMKADGTAVAAEEWETFYECDVSDWKDLVAISAGYYHVLGLKADGTVVASGCVEDGQLVEAWSDVVAIDGAWFTSVALLADGSVVSVGSHAEKFDTGEWTDIVAISSDWDYLVGLKADGTLVACGGDREHNYAGECDVENISGIRVPKTEE